jgi:microcystin-dependent protein
MGVVNTTYTFTSTDTITSAKMNNIIDETTFTGDAIQGTTLQVVSPGKLAVSAGGITSNELASGAVTTNALADGAVTQAKASNMLLPAGAIMAFAMNSAPSGWLAANGESISTGGANAALFAAIGYTYGGSGSSFNLPDLRGYFVRGWGVVGQNGANSDGTVSDAFAAKQADDFKAHTHGFVDGRSYTIPSTTAGTGRASGSGRVDSTVTFDSGTGIETRPKNIAMLYCIKI